MDGPLARPAAESEEESLPFPALASTNPLFHVQAHGSSMSHRIPVAPTEAPDVVGAAVDDVVVVVAAVVIRNWRAGRCGGSWATATSSRTKTTTARPTRTRDGTAARRRRRPRLPCTSHMLPLPSHARRSVLGRSHVLQTTSRRSTHPPRCLATPASLFSFSAARKRSLVPL